jgi:23S rRNA pseudouridine1911/1915/1917 synthase
MPSKNMLPKGKRRQTVKHEYRVHRTLVQEREAALREAGDQVAEQAEPALIDTADFAISEDQHQHGSWIITTGANGSKVAEETHSERRYPTPKLPDEPAAEIHVLDDLEAEDGVRSFTAEAAAKDMRLDAYLAKALPDISRARVQMLIEGGQVTVDGKAAKGKQKLKGGELIEIEGEPQPAPLRAEPEDIPLDIVYEDDDLAVINKAAGMTVHAGAGDEEQNRGTLVNALLFHFGKSLSQAGGEMRPGIVHRLDKQTSGLIVVAKNDSTHRKLGEMFASRDLRKVYIALVHGWMKQDEGTVNLPISRDMNRRVRMTTRRPGGRHAISHWKVLERIGSPEKPAPYGKFTLVEVQIETGRTHQIRVHMQALNHPVVGDTLYGAPHRIPRVDDSTDAVSLDRNFLHATELEFKHPRTKKQLTLKAALPKELSATLKQLRGK